MRMRHKFVWSKWGFLLFIFLKEKLLQYDEVEDDIDDDVLKFGRIFIFFYSKLESIWKFDLRKIVFMVKYFYNSRKKIMVKIICM